MKERGKEELRGLVGWRRWGSPTAMDTQTHRNRYKEQRTGTGWISDVAFAVHVKFQFTVTHMFNYFRAPTSKFMHIRRNTVPPLTQTTTYDHEITHGRKLENTTNITKTSGLDIMATVQVMDVCSWVQMQTRITLHPSVVQVK